MHPGRRSAESAGGHFRLLRHGLRRGHECAGCAHRRKLVRNQVREGLSQQQCARGSAHSHDAMFSAGNQLLRRCVQCRDANCLRTTPSPTLHADTADSHAVRLRISWRVCTEKISSRSTSCFARSGLSLKYCMSARAGPRWNWKESL